MSRPDDAPREIASLPSVVDDIRTLFNEQDVLILEDLNADVAYYREAGYRSSFPETAYRWPIPNAVDMTVAPSDNTYDRIVIACRFGPCSIAIGTPIDANLA